MQETGVLCDFCGQFNPPRYNSVFLMMPNTRTKVYACYKCADDVVNLDDVYALDLVTWRVVIGADNEVLAEGPRPQTLLGQIDGSAWPLARIGCYWNGDSGEQLYKIQNWPDAEYHFFARYNRQTCSPNPTVPLLVAKKTKSQKRRILEQFDSLIQPLVKRRRQWVESLGVDLCRDACLLLLWILRPLHGRDVSVLVARSLWETRFDETWFKKE